MNELCTNLNKTKIMVFSQRKVIPNFPFVFNSNDLNGPVNPDLISPLEHISNTSACPTIKVSGVHLDEYLSFDFHCQKIIKKLIVQCIT